MGISFEPLWKLLEAKGLKNIDLVRDLKLSSATVYKMRRGEVVTTDTLDRLCRHFGVSVESICRYIPDQPAGSEE